MPERDFVIVHRCSVAITLSLNDESTGLAATRCFLMFFKNEGYNYESLFRLALRRVEQLYSDGCGSVFLSTLILNNANMKTV